MLKKIAVTISKLDTLVAKLPESLVALSVRLAIVTVFWRSVQTKIVGWTFFGQHLKFWNVTDSTFFLFEYEYSVPLLPAKIAAYMATFGEFFLSLAIILGLLTRLSAVGLLGMTAVIQFFVYPDSWNVHILWAGLLLYLIRHGAGVMSLDYVLHKRWLA
jgi:putative oxidoreductase